MSFSTSLPEQRDGCFLRHASPLITAVLQSALIRCAREIGTETPNLTCFSIITFLNYHRGGNHEGSIFVDKFADLGRLRMLIDRGFTRVRPLEGGLDAWVDAGFEYERLESAAG